MTSMEQQARNLLERLGWEKAQNLTACDVVELANLLHAAHDAERLLRSMADQIICPRDNTLRRMADRLAVALHCAVPDDIPLPPSDLDMVIEEDAFPEK